RTAREKNGKHLFERSLGVGEGVRKDALHPVVEVADDLEQIFARLSQVLKLFGEEEVPLLERREFFERERVDSPEFREPLLGLSEPLFLLRPIVGDLITVTWHWNIRTVFGDEHILNETEFVTRALKER